jgi:hypothetical protein
MNKIITILLFGAIYGFTPVVSALTSIDADNILFLKQEEKLARDVYQALYAKWAQATFRNISASEQRHMDAVDGLIARYRLTDTTPAMPGRFTFPQLQELYAELIALGSQSLAEALAVGVMIEEMDIADIQEMLDATRESPIRRVLTNLQNGSYNHLEAFNYALDQLTASGLTSSSTANNATDVSRQLVAPTPGNGRQQRGQR